MIGSWITIEAVSDGTYRLAIGPAPTGSFMA